MRGWLSSALVLVAGLDWAAACTPPTFHPVVPRRAESGGQVVEITRADLRKFVLDVEMRGGTAPARIEGAWVGVVGAADGSPCARRLAAVSVGAAAAAGSERTFALRFDGALLDALAGRSDLEVRVVDARGAASCVSVPLSGPGPELRWALEPWGENVPYVANSITLWFPVGSPRYEGGIDLTLLKAGRWWGPARLSAGAGLGFSCCSRDSSSNGPLSIPLTVGAEAFPVVAGRVALGLGAAYEVRPGWSSSGHGFELVQGPVGSVELAYVRHQLNGFLEGPRAGTVGLSFSVARWVPDGGATVLGASLSIN